MDARRAFVTQVLEQVVRALWELSDADFDRLMKGELEASVSFVGTASASASRRARRRQADGPALALVRGADEELEAVLARLTAAGSREEGLRIVEEAFEDKERLFAFAKWLDLPVQRSDAAKRIRDKVVTQTVGRRLSGRAVRGDGGGNGGGEGG